VTEAPVAAAEPTDEKKASPKKHVGAAGTGASTPGKVTPANGTQYVPKITNPGF
jgi:hypothetical protein